MASSLTWIQELQAGDKVLVRDPRTGLKSIGVVVNATAVLVRVNVGTKSRSYYRINGREFGNPLAPMSALFPYTDTAESEAELSQKQARLLGRMLKASRSDIEELTHDQCDALGAALDAAGL